MRRFGAATLPSILALTWTLSVTVIIPVSAGAAPARSCAQANPDTPTIRTSESTTIRAVQNVAEEIKLPVLYSISSPVSQRINAQIRRSTDAWLVQSVHQLVLLRKSRLGVQTGQDSLAVGCLSVFLSSRYLSFVQIQTFSGAGGAHPYDYTMGMTFNVASGALITPSSFFSAPGWQRVLAGETYNQIAKECGPVDINQVVSALETLNGSAVSLAADGLHLDFGEGEVCADAVGIVSTMVSYRAVASILRPTVVVPAAGADEPELSDCVLARVSAELSAGATVLGAHVGASGSVALAETAQPSTTVAVKGQFKVGAEGIFGEKVQASAGSGSAGEGGAATVGGGLLIGEGLTFGSGTTEPAERLIRSLQSTMAPPTSPELEVSERFMEGGVWLDGDLGESNGTAGASSNGSFEGVLGVRDEYQNARFYRTIFYVGIRFAGSTSFGSLVGLSAPQLSGDAEPGATIGGAGEGELIIGDAVDAVGHSVTAQIEGTLLGTSSLLDASTIPGLTALSNVKLPKPTPRIGGTAGFETDVSTELGLTDPRNLQALDALINDGDVANLSRRWAAAGSGHVQIYGVQQVSAKAEVKFGEGAGIGFNADGKATAAVLTEARYFPEGGHLGGWNSCQMAIARFAPTVHK